jgi:hypothetical protein
MPDFHLDGGVQPVGILVDFEYPKVRLKRLVLYVTKKPSADSVAIRGEGEGRVPFGS